jgi:hypothetical protein
MIILTFRPVRSEARTIVRGAYFRICADGTLRGPDNSVTANYANGIWKLAHRSHRSFECEGEVYLRVTDSEGRQQSAGPYQLVRFSQGIIFSGDVRLGAHASPDESGSQAGLLHNVTLLGGADVSRAA